MRINKRIVLRVELDHHGGSIVRMSDRGVDGATLCLCVIMVQAMVLAVASMVLAVLLVCHHGTMPTMMFTGACVSLWYDAVRQRCSLALQL